MAQNKTSDINDVSPDRLLATFTNKSLVQFLLVAVVIHVVVIGVTSLGTFKTWAMGPAVEPTEQPAPDNGADPAATSTTPQTPTNGQPGTQATAPANGAKGQAPANGEAAPGDNTYVEQLRETAPLDEIPTDPDLGISVDDTAF